MFSASVDSRERFLVKQTYHSVPLRYLLQQLHRKLIMISGDIRGCKYGRKLMLSGSDFIMLCFGENSDLPKFLVQIFHKFRNTGLNYPKIMVVKLLTFRGFRSEKSSSGIYKVFSFIVIFFRNKKVLLLGALRLTLPP